MKAVVIMYDSLNRRYLKPYGNDRTITPNFERLAEKCTTFDNFYAGSLPCMPARRDLQTGRLNFLHRGWTPIEPFDDSMPEILGANGIYSHLITDHCHYWEDGGVNYQNRFTTSEYVRGQEGDAWAVSLDDFDGTKRGRRQDRWNRLECHDEKDTSHYRCFEKGRDFLVKNHDRDNWFLQLEYFDPHEPFFVPDRFKKMYTDLAAEHDWPFYRPSDDPVHEGHNKEYITNYCALLTMCDWYLGKILDIFDEYDLWKDTALIVNTDHGFFLDEKGFVGKNYMPVYDELGNLPFFAYFPGKDCAGKRCSTLAQTPDIPVTLLDWFGCKPGGNMLGKSFLDSMEDSKPIHDCILYGYYGMHINITDGRYTYMRAAQTEDNGPLYQYTLQPAHIQKPMSIPELRQAELCPGFKCTYDVPVLKIPVDERYDKRKYYTYSGHLKYGTLLFDKKNDPHQEHPLDDPETEKRLCREMVRLMKENEAPEEQYERMGLEK